MDTLLPKNFWVLQENPRTPNTDAQIAAIAAKFGIRLPALMVELFKTNPGSGKARKRFLKISAEERVPECDGSCTVIFEYSLDACEHWTTQLYCHFLERELTSENDRHFAGLFSFGSDSFNEDAICLDYRRCGNDGEPAVVIATFSGVIQPVSETLEAFLMRLQRRELDDCYSIEANDGEQLWQELARGFSLQIFAPKRGQWNTGTQSVFLDLDPNTDLSGSEPFLDEPESVWILRVSPEESVRATLRQRLDELGLRWKLLFEVDSD